MKSIILVCVLVSGCAYQSETDRHLNETFNAYMAGADRLMATLDKACENPMSYACQGGIALLSQPRMQLQPLLPLPTFSSPVPAPSSSFHGPKFYEVIPPGGQVQIYQVTPQYPY